MSDIDLYETDILLWSERQAELLRRHAAGERINDAAIDWPNIAEEIEDVGRSERNSVEFASGAGPAARSEGRGVASLAGGPALAGRGARAS